MINVVNLPSNTSHDMRSPATRIPLDEAAVETAVTRMRYAQPILYSMLPSINQHAKSVAPWDRSWAAPFIGTNYYMVLTWSVPTQEFNAMWMVPGNISFESE